jgi:hypothetical protein
LINALFLYKAIKQKLAVSNFSFSQKPDFIKKIYKAHLAFLSLKSLYAKKIQNEYRNRIGQFSFVERTIITSLKSIKLLKIRDFKLVFLNKI